ncbi:conserved Plasmodium membrane protein, unknown function [Plasmodium sp. gorilla clade G2]|uniref:conserved Plasmodium membrane protein, unknown function n=1 Tax=Plasmodium sp. gorilla clade G2 TaxID=880535 RepID=UPI000D2281FF|nr:conserved Plasmodium membrane protein, unknown function [Plasmodium sp. gorilla clade G2]SOV12609.1 conserved Plasmodium membrane protein, unknown function [Plasmodium sp. gorilla clade G2]
MKTFALLYKLNVKEDNNENETLFFSLYIHNSYIYVGSTNGRIFIFKKKGKVFFDQVKFVNVIKFATDDVITKICVVENLCWLICGTENGSIFVINNKEYLKKKKKKIDVIVEEGFKLPNEYHYNSITCIKYLIKKNGNHIYIFIGDIDGVLSYILLKKKLIKNKQIYNKLLVDKINGPISDIEICSHFILVTCEKNNILIKLDDILLYNKKEEIYYKCIGKKKENKNYKSIFLKCKRNIKSPMILSLRKNGRIWISKEDKVLNTLVFYYSFFYFFYLFFFNKKLYVNNYIYEYYKNYFLSNSYFVQLLDNIINQFSNFTFPSKPNLNVFYKINKKYFVLFEQFVTYPFFKKINEGTDNLTDPTTDDRIKIKDMLTKDINNIKAYLKNKLNEVINSNNNNNNSNSNNNNCNNNLNNNEEMVVCINYIYQWLNEAEQLLNNFLGKKLFLFNIKSIQIQDILDLNVTFLSHIKIENVDNKDNNRINDNTSNYTNNNVNNHICYNNLSDNNNAIDNHQNEDNNNIEEIKKNEIHYKNVNSKNILYESYFKEDKIVDSFILKDKLYILYFNKNLRDDIYVAYNMNNGHNVCTSFSDMNRPSTVNKNNKTIISTNKQFSNSSNILNCNYKISPFYFCEIHFEKNCELLKCLRCNIENSLNIERNEFYFFYFYILMFHNYINEKKKEENYEDNFFDIIENKMNIINIPMNIKDIIQGKYSNDMNNMNDIEFINNKNKLKQFLDMTPIDNILRKNIETLKMNIRNLLLYSTNEMYTCLLTDKNYIFSNYFFYPSYYHNVREFQYLHYHIKKIKKLYNKMKIIMTKYKFIYHEILTFFVFSNDNENCVIPSHLDKIKKNKKNMQNKHNNRIISKYLNIIKNDDQFLYKVLYYFNLFIYLEINITTYNMRNNTCLTNFPVLYMERNHMVNDNIRELRKENNYVKEKINKVIKNEQINIPSDLQNCFQYNDRINLTSFNNTKHFIKCKGGEVRKYFIKTDKKKLLLKNKKSCNKSNILYLSPFYYLPEKLLFFHINKFVNTNSVHINNHLCTLHFLLYIFKMNENKSVFMKGFKKFQSFNNKYRYNNEHYKILYNKKNIYDLYDENKKKYIFLENYEYQNINKGIGNNDINSVIDPNMSCYNKYTYNKTDFLKFIYIYDNIRNIYNNNKYYDNIKKNNIRSIVDFLNCSKNVYYYHQVIEDVYVVNINNYKQQIYESFLLYQYLLDRCSFYNNVSPYPSSDIKFNQSNYFMKSLTFIKENNIKKINSSIYIKEPHFNEVNIISMEDVKYYEKLNKQITNDNILLLDIFLSTYNNISNNSKMELKNVIKKFSTFNTLGEYINYIQQNENLTDDNMYNFEKEGKKKNNLFLYIYKNKHDTNQNDQSNFYYSSMLYDNTFYYKHKDSINLIDLISYNNNMDNNIFFKNYEENKTSSFFLKEYKEEYMNVQNQSKQNKIKVSSMIGTSVDEMKKKKKKKKYIYISINNYRNNKLLNYMNELNLIINQYIYLNKKYNCNSSSFYMNPTFFTDINFYQLIKLLYILCKQKYMYYFCTKTRKYKRKINCRIKNYDELSCHQKNLHNNRTNKYRINTKKLKKYIYQNVYKLNNKKGRNDEHDSFVYKQKNFKEKKKNRKTNPILIYMNENFCIDLLIYLQKNYIIKKCTGKKRKRILLLLFKLSYIFISLKWNEAFCLLLNIFKYENDEILFALLILSKYSLFPKRKKIEKSDEKKNQIHNNKVWTQNIIRKNKKGDENISLSFADKLFNNIYDNFIIILRKHKMKYENILLSSILHIKNDSNNFLLIIMMIIFFFFFKKSYFIESLFKDNRTKKILRNYYLLEYFFFKSKKIHFLQKNQMFSLSYFKSFNTNGYELFVYDMFLKYTFQMCYELINFQDINNFFVLINNTLYFHFVKLILYLDTQNYCLNLSKYHHLFFIMLSYFYIGYFMSINKWLQKIDHIFISILYKFHMLKEEEAQDIFNSSEDIKYRLKYKGMLIIKEDAKNKENDIKTFNNDIKNCKEYEFIKSQEPNISENKKDSSIIKENIIKSNSVIILDKYNEQEKIKNNILNNNDIICNDNDIISFPLIPLFYPRNHQPVFLKNEQEENKIYYSINYLINFFYELLIKYLCELDYKIYNSKIDLYILQNSKNSDLYIKINNFVNSFYGTCTLMYGIYNENFDDGNKNNSVYQNYNTDKYYNIYNSKKYHNDNNKKKKKKDRSDIYYRNVAFNTKIKIWDEKNPIHLFIQTIDLFFCIYYSLFTLGLSLYEKKKIYVNRKKQYKKYLLSIICVLFYNITNNEISTKDTLIFYKQNMDNNNNNNNKDKDNNCYFHFKRNIIKREQYLNVICCVLCIIHFINYFKYVKKNIIKKFIFIIDYLLLNHNSFYFKEDYQKCTNSEKKNEKIHIHNIYKTIIKNLPKHVKSITKDKEKDTN